MEKRKLETVVFAHSKGGVGKSTLACLFTEYCQHYNIPVHVLDTDANQTIGTWVYHCREEGREVSVFPTKASVKVVDTAGTSGAALREVMGADLVVCPFKPNYADLDLAASWFQSVRPDLQDRFFFVPNMVAHSKEHTEGIDQLRELVESVGRGEVSESYIKHRPAAYTGVLKGLEQNYFDLGSRYKDAQKELSEVFSVILSKLGYEDE